MTDWTTALPDWEQRIVAGTSLVQVAPLFPAEAEAALAQFGDLRMMDAAGSPLMCEVVRPWVTDFVGSIFGSYDPTTGRRLISEFMLLISKKNGKSTIAAGIMLTALIRNWRPSGEFIILAPTKEIADNSYLPIRDMINNDDELKAIFQVQDHLRTVTHREMRSTLKVVAADSDTVSGKKAIGVFVDELWLFGKRPGAEAMLREATGGLASRPEGFLIWATTQSDDPPAGVFRSKLLYARGVRDGRIEDKKFLPVLYEFPEAMLKADAHRDPANAYITNPNMGLSVDEEFIERGYKQALEDGEESFRGFLAKHLNVEIGLALRSDRWTGAEFWERQAVPAFSLDELIARSDVITAGIDGGGLDDMLGLSIVGRERHTGRWMSWARAWVHPVALERRKAEAARYKDFEKHGDLVIIESLPGDVAQVAAVVAHVFASGLLASVGLDPEKTHKIMFQALIDADVPEDIIFGISQGWKLVGAITLAERKLAEGTLIHGGQALMTWCIGNAKVEPRGNAALITKQASGTAKIDPLMAMLNAISLMAQNPSSSEIDQGFVSL
ncbi:terminase large subunit [Massilia genomosp. 1]|uniref:Terminase large subunit n=1 Tax=Massilia genomosp. 1 TaxID=2609280 RepID=A0ABX0MKP4_9BURK|nr:terminase large subunit [Massilia genomosp. 1]NHZ62622.1 terminase large subunit [Massilia genomosp. 1]